MAQTAAQRKAAEDRAAAEAAQQTEGDEFAATGTTPPEVEAADETGLSDAEKVTEAEAQAAEADARAAEASTRLNSVLFAIAKGLGMEPDEKGVITVDDQELIDAAVAKLNTREEPVPVSTEKSPLAAAIRVAVYEQDGAGKALRKWGVIIPLAQANPESVGNVVKRTVEEIVAVPFDQAPMLQQESVED